MGVYRYPFRVEWTPGLPQNSYRNGLGAYEGVVLHFTDNYSSAPDGEASWQKRNWQNAFVHEFIGPNTIIQTANPQYCAWGAGPKANPRFIHIELCVAKSQAEFDASFDMYCQRAAEYLAACKLGVTPAQADGNGTLWSHADVTKYLGGTDHTDPIEYLAKWGIKWQDVIDRVKLYYVGLVEQLSGTPSVPAPEPQPIPAPQPTGTCIFGAAQASVQQAQAWARKRGATECFVALAPIYWRIGAELGVRGDVAYCQAAKETKFGNFGGVLDASCCNWCGLKTTTGGGNDDPNAHMRFPDDETGVRAHIEHLALYAGKVTAAPVDPRHFASICGKAPTVEELGGKWAPNPDYGNSIVRDYLAEMAVTVVAAEPTEAEVAIKFVQDNGLIRGDETGFNGAANITREQLAVVIHRFAKKYFAA